MTNQIGPHFFASSYWPYRSSVHESTGFTTNFLVFGHELTLTIELKYKQPQSNVALPLNKFVLQKQAVFHKAFELVRHSIMPNDCNGMPFTTKRSMVLNITKMITFSSITLSLQKVIVPNYLVLGVDLAAY